MRLTDKDFQFRPEDIVKLSSVKIADIYNKLGELEDVLEKYHIEDAQQLDNVLSVHKRTCENLMKMTHKWEKERRNGKMLELLKKHIYYCKNVDCFVFTSIDDPVTKKKLERWLLCNILD